MFRKSCFVGPLLLLIMAVGPMSLVEGEVLPARAAYVTNSGDDTVSVISLDTREVIRTIGVGQYPLGVAVTPDRQRVYVANSNSNSVSVIDVMTGGVVATVTEGIGDSPVAIAVSRDGNRVYVTNDQSASLSVIETTTNTVVDHVSTPLHPYTLALHPVRDELWVGCNQVLEARSAADLSVLDSLTSSTRAYAGYDLVFRPDGSEAFGAEACGECGRFHRLSGTLPITVLESDILEYNPPGYGYSVEVNSSTGVVYLGKGHSVSEGTMPRIVEFGGLERTLTFAYDDSPSDICFEPEDGLIYVLHQATEGSVSIVDPNTLSIITTVDVGDWPSRIAVTIPEPSALALLIGVVASGLLLCVTRRRRVKVL